MKRRKTGWKLILAVGLLLAAAGAAAAAAFLLLSRAAPEEEVPPGGPAALAAFEPSGADEARVYGRSGRGRELKAFRFSGGDNVLVLTFCLHGFEDAFPQDGAALVATADLLMERLAGWSIPDWTVWVLPCCNPDGLLDGASCDGPGRCTTAVTRADGTLWFGAGADVNRCFPTNWVPFTEPRNYNGDAPLACPEARALAEFLEGARGPAQNVCIDVHGWYAQTITSSGPDCALARVFAAEFPDNTWADVNRGQGYLTAYAAALGYEACLFEFPGGVLSLDGFRAGGLDEAFIRSIRTLVGGK